MIAQIALAIPRSYPYDYLIPTGMEVQVGQRVLVPLGHRWMMGMVVGLKDVSDVDIKKLKEILQVIDPKPLLAAKQLDFFNWMSHYYLASLGLVIDSALPAGIKPKLSVVLEIQKEKAKDIASEDLAWLQQVEGKTANPAQKKALQKWLKAKVVKWAPKLKMPILPVQEVLSPLSRPANKSKSEFRKGSKKALLLAFIQSETPLSQVLESIPKTKPQIKELVELGYLKSEEKPLGPHQGNIFDDRFFALNEEQEKAFQRINEAQQEEKFQTFLLFGVTGSGKTEVYLQAVKTCLKQKKQALILLPEISLTPQTLARFQDRFGDRIAVLHSGMNDTERLQEWYKIQEGRVDVVIGARSAIFAPLTNIGLIVVDEEHDGSYKQQDAPFYHARDLSVKWGKDHNAVVILGSATPAIESFENANSRKYQLLTLSQRASKSPLPEVKVINLKDSERQKGVFYLSKELLGLLEKNLEAGKQAILFLNRRGYSSFLACKSCEEAVLCDHCSIAMTWHKDQNQLRCHSCGSHNFYPVRCKSCGHEKFSFEGIGTQRIERDMRILFPKARFLRMDRDTNSKKGELEVNIKKIHDHEVDFIIGTQLISKGHDFQHVGLVAIIMGDMSLNIPDFRASERSFQLFSQVSGRAGRKQGEEGLSVIQAYKPCHYAISSATNHDYEFFFSQELLHREMLFLPPFAKQIMIRVSDLSPEKASDTASQIAEKLKTAAVSQKFQLLGPVESGVAKLQNRFYFEILLKGENLRELKAFLFQLFWDEGFSTGSRISIDVDP